MARLAQLPAAGFDSGSDRAEGKRVPRLRTRFYAFLSYSHKDKQLADWLHRELERFRVPNSLAGKLTANGVVPRRLTPIFRDQHDLSAGADLAEEIKAALAASQFLIVLCSPTAAKSRWTNQEIESFKRTRPEGCVLAAIVAGEPFASDMPGREEEECFPPALRYKYDRRGHQTAKKAEPLAADFRDDGDGQRLAFLKLVAGMLGVGLDELVQREQTRRHRHMAWLAAGSLAGMAVTSTLAVAAFQARNEARQQRRDAEGLVEFMLGDLRAKLEPIGKLDALDGVGSRVLAYYKKEDATELTDDELLQRSRALNLMAEVAYLRGHLDEADGLYHQALAGTAEAVRRSPNDAKRIFDEAQNVFWLGEIARAQGRVDDAVADYGEYKRLADRLVALEPDNLRWRMEALYGRENVGISMFNKRRYADAESQFESASEPMGTLAGVDSNNQVYQRELAMLLAWLADTRWAEGKLDGAIAARQQQISLLNRLIAAGSGNVEFRQDLVPAHQGLGILLLSRGESERGLEELRSAVAVGDSLIAIEPGNSFWKTRTASARIELARALLALGKKDEAIQQANEACNFIATLRNTGAGNARLDACQTTQAQLALASGSREAALNYAQRALASAQSARGEDPVKDRFAVALAYRLLGDARQTEGDSEGARAAWSSGLAAVPQHVAEKPPELDEHARILERLGRTGEAQPIISRLTAMGYRRET